MDRFRCVCTVRCSARGSGRAERKERCTRDIAGFRLSSITRLDVSLPRYGCSFRKFASPLGLSRPGNSHLGAMVMRPFPSPRSVQPLLSSAYHRRLHGSWPFCLRTSPRFVSYYFHENITSSLPRSAKRTYRVRRRRGFERRLRPEMDTPRYDILRRWRRPIESVHADVCYICFRMHVSTEMGRHLVSKRSQTADRDLQERIVQQG